MKCQRQRKDRTKNKYNHKSQTTEYWVRVIYADQTPNSSFHNPICAWGWGAVMPLPGANGYTCKKSIDRNSDHFFMLETTFYGHKTFWLVTESIISSEMPYFHKGLSIYYVIRDRGAGVFPIYYNITVFKLNCMITVFEGKCTVIIFFKLMIKLDQVCCA